MKTRIDLGLFSGFGVSIWDRQGVSELPASPNSMRVVTSVSYMCRSSIQNAPHLGDLDLGHALLRLFFVCAMVYASLSDTWLSTVPWMHTKRSYG